MAVAEVTFRIKPTNTPAEKITVYFAGAELTLPALQVAELLVDRLRNNKVPSDAVVVPTIGERWDQYAGIYAGVARARTDVDWANGVAFPNVDYHLIVLDEHPDEISWTDAMAWAQRFEDQVDPHAGLPLRAEQALMFANVPELFQKTWYWSREQYAGAAGSAWCQDFDDGYQYSSDKSACLRARAVRRVPIR